MSTTKLEMISNSCTFIEQVGKCEAEIMVLGIYPVTLAWAKRLRNSLRYRLEVVILVEHLGHFRDIIPLLLSIFVLT
jgi:hypothetical protein